MRRGRAHGLAPALAFALGAASCGRATNDELTENSGGGQSTSGGSSASGGRAASGGGTAGGAAGAGAADAGLVCNPDGWCWVAPGEIGDRVDDIHGTSDGAHVFAVSATGTVLERRDDTWRYHDLGEVELRKVHVVADGDVWAGGDGLYQFSDGKWSLSDPQRVSAITHAPKGDMWAILDGRVQRRYPTAWGDFSPVEPMNSFTYVDLVAGSDRQVWALGDESIGRYHQCVLQQFNGTTWSRLPDFSPRDYNVPKLVRSGPNVYAYGLTGVMLASDAWRRVADTTAFQGAFGAPGDTLFIADYSGLVRVDAGGTHVVLSEGVRTVWGDDSGALWVGLQAGGIARLSAEDAASDTPRSEPLQPPVPWEQAPWASVPVRLWANADAAWGKDWRDVWRSLGEELEHFDGAKWTALPTSGVAVDIDGSAPDDVWFVPREAWLVEGNPYVSHWDGASLTRLDLPDGFAGVRLSQIKSFGGDNVFVAGQSADGALLGHFDGTEWSIELEIPLTPFHEHWGELAGLSDRDVWAAGETGVYHFDGKAWALAFTAPNDTFTSVAVDERDVWILGAKRAYHLVGDSFVIERHAHDPFAELDLTEDYVWAYEGRRVLRRRR